MAKRACERALAEGYEAVIVDTSGRLSNNRKLNLELKAIKAAIAETVRQDPLRSKVLCEVYIAQQS